MLPNNMMSIATTMLGAQASVFQFAFENANIKISQKCQDAVYSSAMTTIGSCGAVFLNGFLNNGAKTVMTDGFLSNVCTDNCANALAGMTDSIKTGCAEIMDTKVFSKDVPVPKELADSYAAIFGGQTIGAMLGDIRGYHQMMCVTTNGTPCLETLGKCNSCMDKILELADKYDDSPFYGNVKPVIDTVAKESKSCQLKLEAEKDKATNVPGTASGAAAANAVSVGVFAALAAGVASMLF